MKYRDNNYSKANLTSSVKSLSSDFLEYRSKKFLNDCAFICIHKGDIKDGS